jgi:hypothetical protein
MPVKLHTQRWRPAIKKTKLRSSLLFTAAALLFAAINYLDRINIGFTALIDSARKS